MSEQQRGKNLRELLTVDIERPFGIFLSGGLDSGLLAALLKPDFAYHCRFPLGAKYDESEYAIKIARHLGIELEIIEPAKKDFELALEKSLEIIGQPINSVSIVPWMNLMYKAQGQRMVCGEGSDELFGGYARYLILQRVFGLYGLKELKQYKPMLDSLFKGMHSKLVGIEAPHSLDLNEIMKFEFRHTLPDILYMEDKLAEHYNVDLYRPFMNSEVEKFADKLHLHEKVNNNQTKVLLREIARKYLPEEVVYRKHKQGLVAPVNKWMGWMEDGEFDKKQYMLWQEKILKKTTM